MDMTPEEAKEYAQYLVSQHGFTPDEANQYLGEQGVKLEPTAWDTAKEYGMKGLEGAGRVLDYTGGLTRTGLAAVADPFVDEDIVTEDDVMNAFKGNAPTTADYMDKAGVPEGAEIPEGYPIVGGVSARDVGGFVGDVALDPLTYMTLGASALGKFGKTGKALSPISRGTKSAGKNYYKSGFKKIDEGLIENGKKPLSDVLWDNGRKTGTVKKLSKDSEVLADKLMKERQGLYDYINKKGELVDVNAAAERAGSKIDDLAEQYPAADLDSMKDWIGEYLGQGTDVSADLASKWKTGLYKQMPSSAYDNLGRALPPQKEIQQSFASGLKDEIIGAGERAGQGKGVRVNQINDDLGSLLSSEKPRVKEIRKANTKNAVSSVDAGLAGYAVTNPLQGIPILLAKKGGDLGKTTWFRTKAGKTLNAIGESGLPDSVTRQMYIDMLGPQSPWEAIKKPEEK